MSSNSTSMSPEQILKRLDELRKWQEQQQQLLIQRQNSQRQLLDEEQRVLYEKLGFASPVNKYNAPKTRGNEERFERPFNLSGSSTQFSFDDTEMALSNSSVGITLSNLNQIAHMEDQLGSQNDTKQANDKNEKCIKRPFLKKGEGLSNRFKINPEKFRLHNLPKYKYAHKHKIASQARLPEILPKKFSNNEPSTSKAHIQANIKKRDTRSESTASAINSATNIASESSGKSIRKVQFSPVKNPTKVEKVFTIAKDKKDMSAKPIYEDSDLQLVNTNKIRSASPVSWADVLNPNNIKPISLENLRKYVEFNSTETSLVEDDFDNLSLFELLEKKAQEGSILIDSSILQRYINNIQTTEPAIEESLVDTQTTMMKKVSPLPFDIDTKILAHESEESSTEPDENFASSVKLGQCRVRFSDDIIVNEITSESESDVSILAESKTSTPSDKDSSQRSRIFVEDSITDTENSITFTNAAMNSHEKELIEKTDHLKTRLADLEREISEFQRHNSELIKLKQECEIERIRLEQEKSDLSERLKDEQIKLEIRLHDERIKLEEERKRYEKLIKEHRLKGRKESEEITKLKEQVEQLQKENREKELKHSAAQARLRAQIRNLEKDLKEFSMEVDVLKKEKRRLEGENSKLMRQNNNKMLQEINKSIAKLVPKAISTETEVKNKNTKPVVAKVTSHTNNLPRQHLSKGSITTQNIAKPNKMNEESDDNDSDSTEDDKSAYFRSKRQPVKRCEEPSESSEIEIETAKVEHHIEALQMEDEFKREITNPDGSKDIWYTNGNLKKISADGMLIRMLYYNKDIKETNINEGTVKYYYAETNTWHTTYLDGLEILEFPNGQTEHRYKDGTIEVHFENGSIRITDPNDPAKLEEWRYADGTRLIQLKTGDKIISFPNGQKEVHTKVHKRREYPDGTVKIVYPDGSQETRYSNGRVRLKDKDGNLIMDSVS